MHKYISYIKSFFLLTLENAALLALYEKACNGIDFVIVCILLATTCLMLIIYAGRGIKGIFVGYGKACPPIGHAVIRDPNKDSEN